MATSARRPYQADPIALVDVRCMFVSVERVLDPTLVRRPTIVLSNNDGCAVSRSDEDSPQPHAEQPPRSVPCCTAQEHADACYTGDA